MPTKKNWRDQFLIYNTPQHPDNNCIRNRFFKDGDSFTESAVISRKAFENLKSINKEKQMSRNNLYLKYAEVIKMCKDTELEEYPWRCVSYKDEILTSHPNFNNGPNFSNKFEDYKFALAVLENKPVFAGDTVYHKDSGQEFVIDEDGYFGVHGINLHISSNNDLTWEKPKEKKMFHIDCSLPAPSSSSSKTDYAISIEMAYKGVITTKAVFYYNDEEDCEQVYSTIESSLDEAIQ